MNRLAQLICALPAVAFIACGDSKPQPQAPTASAEPTTESTAAPVDVPAATAAPTAAAKPTPAADEDPTESSGKITMRVLMAASPKFPPAKASEAECWKTIGLTGNHKKDYEALIAACGTPTGLVEYTAPAMGRLHSVTDQRDTFTLKLRGGFCYRYFAVADDTIKDLDILIETDGGALVGEDKSTGPVAIIESSKSWCQNDDVEYTFQVKVDGAGKGAYVFGVWARKK